MIASEAIPALGRPSRRGVTTVAAGGRARRCTVEPNAGRVRLGTVVVGSAMRKEVPRTRRGVALIAVAGVVAVLWWYWDRDPPSSPAPQPAESTAAMARPSDEPPPAPPPPPIAGQPRNSLPVALPPVAPAQARVRWLQPKDGEVVPSPVRVVAQVEGMTLAPAGTLDSGTGHLHVLVDVAASTSGAPIAPDAQHLDLGEGEVAGDVELPLGSHRLQLVLGDGLHVPFEPPVESEIISVTVR